MILGSIILFLTVPFQKARAQVDVNVNVELDSQAIRDRIKEETDKRVEQIRGRVVDRLKDLNSELKVGLTGAWSAILRATSEFFASAWLILTYGTKTIWAWLVGLF